MNVIIIYARMASMRVPNKAAMNLAGKPLFLRCLERAAHNMVADEILLATTVESTDDALVELANANGIAVFRGNQWLSERMIQAFDYLALKDDDMVTCIGCDSPLVYCDHLTVCLELMRRWELAETIIWQPRQTLLSAVGVINPSTIRAFRRRHILAAADPVSRVEGDDMWWEPLAESNLLIKVTTPVLMSSWSVGGLTVDYPQQALVMRQIYKDTYGEAPISYDALRSYLDCTPVIQAILGDMDFLKANRPLSPHDTQEERYNWAKLTTRYVEIKFDGGAYEVIESNISTVS